MFLYVHKYPPARPSEANFTLPEPARSPKSQKKAGSSPPEARKLEARTSLPPSPSPNLTYAWIIQQTYHRTDEKKKDCLYFQEFLGIFIVIIIV